jgi:hypothetical protein
MEVLHERCCGLDVHKETVVACLRLVVQGKFVKEARTFSTTTTDLMNLSEWLAQNKCTHVAMEATGCLLEACLAHLVRWRLRASAGERRGCHERAGS